MLMAEEGTARDGAAELRSGTACRAVGSSQRAGGVRWAAGLSRPLCVPGESHLAVFYLKGGGKWNR